MSMKEFMINEKNATPKSMMNIPKIFSPLEIGNRSPYPTVDSVVIEKYEDVIILYGPVY